MGLEIHLYNASTSREINAAFATFVRERLDAVLVGLDPFFNSRRIQRFQLATRYAIPTSYPARDFADAGGLISYGANIADAWRQVGVYARPYPQGCQACGAAGRASSKFELVINAETARMLGVEMPPSLLARADEVIE